MNLDQTKNLNCNVSFPINIWGKEQILPGSSWRQVQAKFTRKIIMFL